MSSETSMSWRIHFSRSWAESHRELLGSPLSTVLRTWATIPNGHLGSFSSGSFKRRGTSRDVYDVVAGVGGKTRNVFHPRRLLARLAMASTLVAMASNLVA